MQLKKNKRTKRLVKAIKLNLKRRTIIVDDKLQFFKKKPIPSWIELSIIDVCNRTCSFCPKSDPSIAPDTYQRMSLTLIDKLCRDLKRMKYKGSVTLCGYGEPMLHKEVFEVCKRLAKVSFVEVVTNGDTLNEKSENGRDIKYENIEPLIDMFQDIKIPNSCTELDKEIAGVPSTLTNIT